MVHGPLNEVNKLEDKYINDWLANLQTDKVAIIERGEEERQKLKHKCMIVLAG